MKKFSVSGGGNEVRLITKCSAPKDVAKLQCFERRPVFARGGDVGGHDGGRSVGLSCRVDRRVSERGGRVLAISLSSVTTSGA